MREIFCDLALAGIAVAAVVWLLANLGSMEWWFERRRLLREICDRHDMNREDAELAIRTMAASGCGTEQHAIRTLLDSKTLRRATWTNL